MTPANKLLPAILAGSHAQPDWLIGREKLARVVSRVPAERLSFASACGMKYLPRNTAFLQTEGHGRWGRDRAQ